MQTNEERSCKFSFGLSHEKGCSNFSRSLTLNGDYNSDSEANITQLSATVDVSAFLMKPVREITCFVVRASDGRCIAETESTLTVDSGEVATYSVVMHCLLHN